MDPFRNPSPINTSTYHKHQGHKQRSNNNKKLKTRRRKRLRSQSPVKKRSRLDHSEKLTFGAQPILSPTRWRLLLPTTHRTITAITTRVLRIQSLNFIFLQKPPSIASPSYSHFHSLDKIHTIQISANFFVSGLI